LEVFETLELEVLKRGKRFEPKALATLCKAFAEGRAYHPSALDVLGRGIAKQVEKLVPFHAVCTVAWSFASLRHDSPGLFEGIWQATAIQATKKTARPSDLAAVLYALGVAGKLDHAKMEQIKPKIEEIGRQAGLFSVADLCSLFQVELLLNPENRQDLHSLPPVTLKKATRAWRKVSIAGSTASEEQVTICKLLRAMGLPVSLEHETEDGLFVVDIALHGENNFGKRVAFEVNGMQHYTRTRPHRELGAVVLRKKLLEDRGWVVIDLPLHAWAAVKDDRAQARKWLESKLSMAGIKPKR